MLICIGGLPGVGKTTVARTVSAALPATHLRIDTFEAALVRQGLVRSAGLVGSHGYGLALAAADTCLTAGTDVVVDAVFPVAESRASFSELATRHGVDVHWFHLVCGDGDEHRRRVETRATDLSGFPVPTWGEVTGRQTDGWGQEHVVVDTTGGDPAATVLRAISPR